MTSGQYIDRAARALDNDDREAADYFLLMAQLAGTPPEAEELVQGAERIRAIAGIIGALVLLALVYFLVGYFGL